VRCDDRGVLDGTLGTLKVNVEREDEDGGDDEKVSADAIREEVRAIFDDVENESCPL